MAYQSIVETALAKNSTPALQLANDALKNASADYAAMDKKTETTVTRNNSSGGTTGIGAALGTGLGLLASCIPGMQAFAPALMAGGGAVGGGAEGAMSRNGNIGAGAMSGLALGGSAGLMLPTDKMVAGLSGVLGTGGAGAGSAALGATGGTLAGTAADTSAISAGANTSLADAITPDVVKDTLASSGVSGGATGTASGVGLTGTGAGTATAALTGAPVNVSSDLFSGLSPDQKSQLIASMFRK